MNESTRRETAKDRVLTRLFEGPATNAELNTICFRYGARIKELRDRGYNILTERVGKGAFSYRLQP